MMLARLAFVLFACTLTLHATAEDDPHATDRAALRAMLTDVEKALNERDIRAALKHLHADVLITYYNAEVTRGHGEAVAYFSRMMEGAGAIVKEYSTEAEVGSPAIFVGDTAVAYGTTTESYKLAEGLEFTLQGNWSTTVQKHDGQWMVRAIHFSTNLFDNPLLSGAEQVSWWAAGGGFVVGLVVMWTAGRVRRRTA